MMEVMSSMRCWEPRRKRMRQEEGEEQEIE
jgi:hypothetical protein